MSTVAVIKVVATPTSVVLNKCALTIQKKNPNAPIAPEEANRNSEFFTR
jgi:hypothetical protein